MSLGQEFDFFLILCQEFEMIYVPMILQLNFLYQKIMDVFSVQANYMDAWKCVATLRGDGQAASESLPASLGKQGFTKLPMSSHQANWH